MRCKVGDLAVFVKSLAGNEGAVIRVVRFVGPINFTVAGFFPDVWEIDPPVRAVEGGVTRRAPDAWLRPLRDGEGTDETIRIAGLPREIAHA